MRLNRKDPYLDDALELLDRHIEKANGDFRLAYTFLTPHELVFIDGEIEKCVSNFRYYAENYHVIASEYEGHKVLHPWWDSQEIFYEKVFEIQIAGKPVRIIVLKARQLGLSTICQALTFHKTIFTPSCNTLIIAQDPGQADYLFSMSRTAYESLPWWMRPETRYEAKSRYMVFDRKDPTERMMSPGLRSQIFVDAANKMTGAAVGKTIRAVHMSELSEWDNASILTENLFPTMNAPDELAIMESTARGTVGFWYRFWKSAMEGKTDWQPVFIEFFRVKKYSTSIPAGEKFELTPEEVALRGKVKKEANFDLADEQLKWRRDKINEFIAADGEEWGFYQEYPGATWLEAFQGSGLCAFDKRKLQTMLETQCCPPILFGEIDLDREKDGKLRPHLKAMRKVDRNTLIPPQENYGSRLHIWEKPIAGERYSIGADVAQGILGGNYSCAQVFKIGKGMKKDEQVAEWHGLINPTPYASVLAGLGFYYNTAEIAVECNNDVGGTTNNQLLRVIEYPNMFRWKHYDKIKNYFSDFMGWYTNSKTRGQIITKMRESISDGTIIIRSEAMIEEMRNFAREEGERRYEGQGTDDDRVMSGMICIFCPHDMDWGVDKTESEEEDEETIRKRKREDYINTDYAPAFEGSRKKNLPPGKAQLPSELGLPTDMTTSQIRSDVPEEDQWKLL